MYSLEALGLTAELRAHARPDTLLGRVIAEHRGQVETWTEVGAVRATVPTVQSIDAPATGDWVLLTHRPDHAHPYAVDTVLPRFSRVVRRNAGHSSGQVVAANLHTVFVATSLNRDFNRRRLERYVTLIQAGGAQVVVVLTKADLVGDLTEILDQVPCDHRVALSALHRLGLEQLEPWLQPGQTVAVMGSSGVGKSTLVNALMGETTQDTGAIREHDARGRHTTTARRLLVLPGGACLIDTPGMREVGLYEGDLGAAFQDIEALALECPWRDCSHEHEPGCAVLAAVDAGTLDPDRVWSHAKLSRELAREQQRQRDRARKASKRNRKKRPRNKRVWER